MIDGLEAPWEHDGFNVGVPMEPGVYYFRMPSQELARLVALAPELRDALREVNTWLGVTDSVNTNHGAHTAFVEANKLLARVEGL